MRKHPVIFGLLILTGICILSYFYFYRMGLHSSKSRNFSFKSNKIGVVFVEGVINDSLDITEELDDFARDDSIAAVVLRVDSPGGGVAASQEIYDAVTELKKTKKVVASMGSIAASGGLLVACAADKIVANPGTITGSISAIMHFANFEELMKKVGVKSSVVKSGQYKDIGSPTREMTPEEKVIVQDLVDDIYNQFVDVIVKERKLPREKVVEIADGRVFSGRKAKELGLVDYLGDMTFAAKEANRLAGKKGDFELVYPSKKKFSFFDYFMESAANKLSSSIKEKVASTSGLSYIYYPAK